MSYKLNHCRRSFISYQQLKSLAADCGLDICSVISREQLEPYLLQNSLLLKEWQEQGFAGDMEYMNRDIGLFENLQCLLDGAFSVVSFLVRYQDTNPGPRPKGKGRVARYAWGLDYHLVLRRLLNQLVSIVGQRIGNSSISFRIFSDAVPLLERTVGHASGLGFIGKNTLLIRPGVGSMTFLAEVIWNLDVVSYEGQNKVTKRDCGSCSRCLKKCPTDALVSERTLDARKCISYLTIEKRQVFNVWESKAVGDWVFGCDICQETCPFNHRGLANVHLQEFSSEFGSGPFLDLESLMAIRTNSQFKKRFAKTALLRSGRLGILRNACAVAVNCKELQLLPAIINIARNDSSKLLRLSAYNALIALKADTDGKALRLVNRTLDDLRSEFQND